MYSTRGVYLFDEFDAIGSRRNSTNDVGEIRRILNSFLQFLETDESRSLVVAATNHPELLDSALYRRFDDVIEYTMPGRDIAKQILETRLKIFNTQAVDWSEALKATDGLSQAAIARAGDDAAKIAVLSGHKQISTRELVSALGERQPTRGGFINS
jgi:SpoVK/Ycf46/Vps4 family AAA+-type ATPase